MKVFNRVFLVFLFILFVLSALWVYREALLQSFISVALQEDFNEADISDLDLDIQHIDSDNFYFSTIKFNIEINQPDTFKANYQVVINGLSLKYNQKSLLDGRLQTVSVDDVQITQQPEIKGNDTDTLSEAKESLPHTEKSQTGNEHLQTFFEEQARSVAGILHDIPGESIPFQSLSVKKLMLSGSNFEGLSDRVMTVGIENCLKKEEATLSVSLKSDALNRQVALSISRDSHLTINIDQSRTAVVNIKATTGAIKADYKINPDRMTSLVNLVKPGAIPLRNAVQSGVIEGKVIVQINNNLQQGDEAYREKQSLITMKTGGIKFRNTSIVSPEAGFLFNYRLNNDSIRFQPGFGSFLRYKSLEIGNTSISNNDINLHGEVNIKDNNGLSVFADLLLSTETLELKQLYTKSDVIEMAARNVQTAIMLEPDRVSFKGDFQHQALSTTIDFNGKHDLSTGKGDLSVTTREPFDFSAEENRLSKLVTPWSYPFDIVSGTADVDAKLKWGGNNPFTLSSRVAVEEAGGFYNELVFSGIETTQNLDILPVLETVRTKGRKRIGNTGLVRISSLDSGVLISDISFQLAIKSRAKEDIPVIELHNLDGHLLGGRFYSHALSLDFSQPVNRFDVHVENIDLAHIAETQQFEGLKLSGRLNGKLPVELDQNGVFVHHGYFDNAGRKGYIQYQPSTGTEQVAENPLSNIALKALRDFRYSTLAASVSYIPDGTLSLSLKMKGVSPVLGSNRAVNLNINTEQNVKALLKSLRYVQGLNESIDSRVRRMYQ